MRLFARHNNKQAAPASGSPTAMARHSFRLLSLGVWPPLPAVNSLLLS
jgi:hypothetical protein